MSDIFEPVEERATDRNEIKPRRDKQNGKGISRSLNSASDSSPEDLMLYKKRSGVKRSHDDTTIQALVDPNEERDEVRLDELSF